MGTYTCLVISEPNLHFILIILLFFRRLNRSHFISEMFSSDAYYGLFRELYNSVKSEDGITKKDWCTVNLVKWHVLGDVELNSTDDEAKYSRAYITELAAQFREEEFILRIQLKGYGVQFQVGFSTDVSESCIWLTPFIKFSEDMSDVR